MQTKYFQKPSRSSTFLKIDTSNSYIRLQNVINLEHKIKTTLVLKHCLTVPVSQNGELNTGRLQISIGNEGFNAVGKVVNSISILEKYQLCFQENTYLHLIHHFV